MKSIAYSLEFASTFSTEEECLNFLCKLKWDQGYECRKCSHKIAVKGRKWYYRRCQNCRYDESCTAHTLFHKLKFPICNAFMIVYQLSTLKKGLSTCEISRQHKIHQETGWFFKRKVQQAMNEEYFEDLVQNKKQVLKENFSLCSVKKDKSHKKPLLDVNVRIQIKTNEGRGELLSLRIEPSKDIKRCKINRTQKSELKKEKKLHRKIKLNFKIGTNSSIPKLKCHIFNLKNWIRGIHHSITLEHLERYLHEYQYRFNTKNSTKRNPNRILAAMIASPWLPYSKAMAN